MAYGTPTDPVAGTVITVAYAVANFLNPIRALRAFTGGADPPGSNYVVTSDSTSVTSWKTMAAAVLAAIGYTPVNRAGDTMTSDLAVTRSGAAQPTVGYLILGNNTAYYIGFDGAQHVVRTPKLNVQGDLYVDRTVAGAPTTGYVILGNNAAHYIGFNGTNITTPDAISALAVAVTTGLSGATLSVTGAVSAASATLSGALSAASATLSGAINAASAAITNGITAATMTATGLVKGSALESTVGTGTAPLVVASATQVANLRAATAAAATLAADATLMGGFPWFTPVHVDATGGTNFVGAYVTITGLTYTTTRTGRYLVEMGIRFDLVGTVSATDAEQFKARVQRTGSGTVNSKELRAARMAAPGYAQVSGGVVISAVSGDVLSVQAQDSLAGGLQIQGAQAWAEFIWIGS